MGAGAGELATVHDQVFLTDRLTTEIALQDLADACGVASLRGEACAGGVRCHALIGHRAPRVVLWRGLGKPHVARIPGELSALARPRDCLAVADLAAGSVDEVGTALHLAEHLRVEKFFGLRM